MLNNITYDLLLFLLIISLSQLWSLLSLPELKKFIQSIICLCLL